jgi:UDP-N-acetylglucosamine transferase subunit ALG13
MDNNRMMEKMKERKMICSIHHKLIFKIGRGKTKTTNQIYRQTKSKVC